MAFSIKGEIMSSNQQEVNTQEVRALINSSFSKRPDIVKSFSNLLDDAIQAGNVGLMQDGLVSGADDKDNEIAQAAAIGDQKTAAEIAEAKTLELANKKHVKAASKIQSFFRNTHSKMLNIRYRNNWLITQMSSQTSHTKPKAGCLYIQHYPPSNDDSKWNLGHTYFIEGETKNKYELRFNTQNGNINIHNADETEADSKFEHQSANGNIRILDPEYTAPFKMSAEKVSNQFPKLYNLHHSCHVYTRRILENITASVPFFTIEVGIKTNVRIHLRIHKNIIRISISSQDEYLLCRAKQTWQHMESLFIDNIPEYCHPTERTNLPPENINSGFKNPRWDIKFNTDVTPTLLALYLRGIMEEQGHRKQSAQYQTFPLLTPQKVYAAIERFTDYHGGSLCDSLKRAPEKPLSIASVPCTQLMAANNI